MASGELTIPSLHKGGERMGHPTGRLGLHSLLVERASGVLAVALDLGFLFGVGVVAIFAAILFVLWNYTLAHRVGALLVVSHVDFPFLR